MKFILAIPFGKTAHRTNQLEGSEYLFVQHLCPRTLQQLCSYDLAVAVKGDPDRRDAFDPLHGRLLGVAPDSVDRIFKPPQKRTEQDIITVQKTGLPLGYLILEFAAITVLKLGHPAGAGEELRLQSLLVGRGLRLQQTVCR